MLIDDRGFLLNIRIVGGGNVTSTPNNHYYPKGTLVALNAIANDGERFIQWQGDAVGSHHTCNFRLNESLTIIAVFSNATIAAL